MSKIYLYIARRDKKGMRLVAVLDGPVTSPVRLREVSLLNLPPHVEADVTRVIQENRMYWEPWLESAASYQDLKQAVRARGYTQVPVHSNILCPAQLSTANMASHPSATTMIRKNQD